MKKIDWKKRAESLAKDNIKLITDNASLKVENKQLKEQLALTGVGKQSEILKAFKEWERWDYKKPYDTPTDEIVSDYLSLQLPKT